MNPLKNFVSTPDDIDYGKIPEKVSTVEGLPPEVLSHILSFLNNREMHAPLEVNHYWRNVSIGTVRSREQSLIKKFTKFLAGNMQPPYSSQMKQLLSPENDEKIFDNLKEIKAFSLEFRGKALNILKNLKKGLEGLEKLSANKSKPNLFENIFTLAKLYKSFDRYLGEEHSSFALGSISEKLAKEGDLDKALEVANIVSSEMPKFHALLTISVQLAEAGRLDQALEVANTIPHKGRKFSALRSISDALAKAGRFDQALEVANTIPAEADKSFALISISDKLAEAGRFDQALEVANTIPDKEYKSSALRRRISDKLAKAGK